MVVPLHVTRRTFLSNLKRSGLLSREQYHDAKQLVPETERGRLLARELVRQGLLTRFQAERLLIGRTDGFFLDQYIVQDELGRGGMGRVYMAKHRTMHRIVAVKVLAPDLTSSERAQDMFLREVRAVAQLVHPNIVTAYDANKAGDRYYLVLEYVDGPNLDQLVKANGRQAIGQSCDFIRQAAQGLQCAHLAGMVHRDIKPANILIQRRAADGSPGLVKINDFGLARLIDPVSGEKPHGTILTRPNTVMGTPDYLSPEQARNLHKTDIRSDIYSLGCTFYYLLTGTVPFPGGTPMEKLIRHTNAEPTPIEVLRPETPAEVVAILNKMMAKRPEDRYQTPAELVQALEPFSVSGPTPWEPTRPPAELPPEENAPLQEGADSFMAAAGSLQPTVAANPEYTPRAEELIVPAPKRSYIRRRLLILILLILMVMTLFLLAATAFGLWEFLHELL